MTYTILQVSYDCDMTYYDCFFRSFQNVSSHKWLKREKGPGIDQTYALFPKNVGVGKGISQGGEDPVMLPWGHLARPQTIAWVRLHSRGGVRPRERGAMHHAHHLDFGCTLVWCPICYICNGTLSKNFPLSIICTILNYLRNALQHTTGRLSSL